MDGNSPLFYMFAVPKSRIKKNSDIAGAVASVHDQYVMLFTKDYGCVIMTYGTEQI